MIKFNKSQSALEFLTTYGWAFLVILIMIGTLAYFGILTPSKVLPNRCSIGAEFSCLDYKIDATGSTFRIRLKNNVGEPISISALALGSEGSTAFSCTLTTPAALPFTFATGTPQDFIWGTCNPAAAGMVAGEKGKVLLTITYNSVASGSTYARQTKGEVYAAVQ